MDASAEGTTLSVAEPLTRREREVLGLLAEGLTAPEIAERLTLATSSVKSHMVHLYGKLQAHSKRQAVRRAHALGLLGAPGGLAPRPAAVRPLSNLPKPLTRLFGRDHDLTRVRACLAEWRLVTLTGTGGVGKTRLALRAAEEALAASPDGVWFVELAPLSDPALVVGHVAASLKVAAQPGQTALESLLACLRERQALLVLDGCEHLLGACAALAERLLRACPRLRLLVTSREPLGVAGEAVCVVDTLPCPEPQHSLDHAELSGSDALSLFVDRARAVLPGYAVTPANAATLARICRRLDGLPLALELAAAWMNLLTAEQLSDRLDDALRILTGGSRAALARHHSLRASLDWSYALLTEPERLLLLRLSGLAGSCTLEVVEGLCDELEGGQALDLLSALVRKSMVVACRRAGQSAHYHLLETVRLFARDKLAAGAARPPQRMAGRDTATERYSRHRPLALSPS